MSSDKIRCVMCRLERDPSRLHEFSYMPQVKLCGKCSFLVDQVEGFTDSLGMQWIVPWEQTQETQAAKDLGRGNRRPQNAGEKARDEAEHSPTT